MREDVGGEVDDRIDVLGDQVVPIFMQRNCIRHGVREVVSISWVDGVVDIEPVSIGERFGPHERIEVWWRSSGNF